MKPISRNCDDNNRIHRAENEIRQGIKRSHYIQAPNAFSIWINHFISPLKFWQRSHDEQVTSSSCLSVFNIASSILYHQQYCIILSQCFRNHFLGKAPTMIDNSICLQTFGSKGRSHLIEYDMRNILINNQFHYKQYNIWSYWNLDLKTSLRFSPSRISAQC